MSARTAAREDSVDAAGAGPTGADQTPAGAEHAGAGSLALPLALYTLARLGLVVVAAAIILGVGMAIGVTIPLLVAAVFGVLIALPLGMVLFKPLRLRVNRQIAIVDADRKRRHDDLQARLRGNDG